nr:MAG: hypothetical protein 1 [Leviviridae sp.]
MANQKSNEWYDNPIEGINRSSAFASFSPYSSLGFLSKESRLSVNHAKLNDGRWSGGGPFFLSRDIKTYSPNRQRIKRYTSSGTNLLTDGLARIESPTSGIPTLAMPSHPSDLQLMADGTTAIARTEPTNPAFDLSVFLGELKKEGLPNLPGAAAKEKTQLAKASGSEYLNLEFGWFPFIRGIRDFAKTVDESDRILNQYQQGSGKVIQRSYEWPTVDDSRADACTFAMNPAVGFYSGGGRHQHVSQRKWFEVEYMYHVPAGGSINDKFRRFGSNARKLLGVDLSPEVLWNLSPWSWAADWFSNTGDVMHNISALGTDGLVMRHSYIMCHTQRVTTDTGTFSNTGVSWTQTATRREEFKTRIGATPYGFGVAFDTLSAKQLAVIAALGLSRW